MLFFRELHFRVLMGQNRTKSHVEQQKQTNATIFQNLIILSPKIQNLNGRSVLDKLFLKVKHFSSTLRIYWLESDLQYWEFVKNYHNAPEPPRHHLTAKFFPLKRVLKNRIF